MIFFKPIFNLLTPKNSKRSCTLLLYIYVNEWCKTIRSQSKYFSIKSHFLGVTMFPQLYNKVLYVPKFLVVRTSALGLWLVKNSSRLKWLGLFNGCCHDSGWNFMVFLVCVCCCFSRYHFMHLHWLGMGKVGYIVPEVALVVGWESAWFSSFV